MEKRNIRNRYNGASIIEVEITDGAFGVSELSNKDLQDCRLRDCNLNDINLSGSTFRGSDLSFSRACRSNFRNADLSKSKLVHCDFTGSDFTGVTLNGSDTAGANLPIYCKWDFSIKGNMIFIGCQQRTMEEWDNFFSPECKEVIKTPRDSEEFKRIRAMYEAHKAYIKIMGGN